MRGMVFPHRIGLWRSLASALAWGARGPELKSRQPDQIEAENPTHAIFSAGSLTILKSKPQVWRRRTRPFTTAEGPSNSNQYLTTVSLHSRVYGVYTRTDSRILLDIEGECDGSEHRIASGLSRSLPSGSLLDFTGDLAADPRPPRATADEEASTND